MSTIKNLIKGTGSYKIGEIALAQGELVINGGFDTDTGWAKQGATTISNGFANINESSIGISVINQSGVANLKPYTRYIMSYDVVNWVSGNIRMRIDNNYSALLLSNGNGHYSMEMQTGSINSPIRFITAENNTVLSIDNVSVTEIPALPDLDIGAKYLEDTSSGTAALPSKTAYGTWEWDVYKKDITHINFISDGIDVSSDSGYRISLSSNEQIILRKRVAGSNSPLGTTAVSYISDNTWYRLKVARLQSEGVFKDIETLQTGFENSGGSLPYDIFISNDKYNFSATNISGTGTAGTYDEISYSSGDKFLIEFDLKLNSGALPYVRMRSIIQGTEDSNVVTSMEGKNSFILTATTNTTGVLEFRNTVATDYEVSGLTIRRIYDADTFAVFIKGGDFGTDKWTLVDTTGGSGSNPCTDGTYSESNYFVCDLDSGDKISNIKITNGVTQ